MIMWFILDGLDLATCELMDCVDMVERQECGVLGDLRNLHHFRSSAAVVPCFAARLLAHCETLNQRPPSPLPDLIFVHVPIKAFLTFDDMAYDVLMLLQPCWELVPVDCWIASSSPCVLCCFHLMCSAKEGLLTHCEA